MRKCQRAWHVGRVSFVFWLGVWQMLGGVKLRPEKGKREFREEGTLVR